MRPQSGVEEAEQHISWRWNYSDCHLAPEACGREQRATLMSPLIVNIPLVDELNTSPSLLFQVPVLRNPVKRLLCPSSDRCGDEGLREADQRFHHLLLTCQPSPSATCMSPPRIHRRRHNLQESTESSPTWTSGGKIIFWTLLVGHASVFEHCMCSPDSNQSWIPELKSRTLATDTRTTWRPKNIKYVKIWIVMIITSAQKL